MNIFIGEDRIEDYLHLKKMIEKWAHMNQIPICFYHQSQLFYQLPDELHLCQIAFLDIDMAGVNGYDFATYIRKWNRDIEIVFQSQSSLYGALSYRVRALDYLLKPLQEKHVFAVLDCVLTKEQKQCLILKQRHQIKTIKFDEILYIYMKDHQSVIQCFDRQEVTYYSLLKLKELLDQRFVQCFRGYLVNIHFIQRVGKEQILLHNHQRLPLSRKYLPLIKEKMMQQRP